MNVYPHTEAGFNTLIRDFIRTFVQDPNARKTQMKAFGTKAWRYFPDKGITLNDHVVRVKCIFREMKYLSGTHPLEAEDLKDVFFGTFSLKWRENYLMKGSANYEIATVKNGSGTHEAREWKSKAHT